ncbi:putative nuclease HARBI1 [Heterodontus francisci]|uniref:putative nuclease HARBI1 n=1 Tax=Heterodontus francisci TaxID=7792 RepID=UPI00355C9870
MQYTGRQSLGSLGSFQGPTGDMCGISQSAAHHCIRVVTDALFKRVNQYIHYQTAVDSQPQRARGFVTMARFLRCEGLHDTAGMWPSRLLQALQQPSLTRRDFILSTGNSSATTINETCRYVHGTLGEATTLTFSGTPRCHSFYPPPRHHPHPPPLPPHTAYLPGWILANKGYLLKRWLLTPVRSPMLEAEEHYNTSHAATRATIEQTIGLLKVRFRCLDHSSGALQYVPNKGLPDSVGVCILYNLAVQRGETLADEDLFKCEESSDKEEDEESDDQLKGMRVAQRTK